MRKFASGATRDEGDYKLDYEGFLNPLALEVYAEYMHHHQKQADGQMRASDDWQKGIPKDVYAKSLMRHFIDVWKIHRGYAVRDRRDGHVVTIREALCGVLFNAFGYLKEEVNPRSEGGVQTQPE